ncbi:MAG TPA: PcfJ domain-containing protein [Verrucomicrobiae bacterium]
MKPFRYLEKRPGGVELEWRMVELLNSTALHAEAGAMRHCVYSYTGRCMRRISGIWSLRVRTENGEKRVLTVEVNPRTRRIVQVRAAQNRRAGGRSYGILRKWAQFAGVALWVR